MQIQITESHKRAHPGNPGRGTAVFTKGETLEVGKTVSKAMADRLIECKMAKEVKDSAGDAIDEMSVAQLKVNVTEAGGEYTNKADAKSFLRSIQDK